MDNLYHEKHSKSNIVSLIIHILLIWGAISIRSAHILTPSRSDGMEVALISSSDIQSPQLVPQPIVTANPVVTEVTPNNDANIKVKTPEVTPISKPKQEPTPKIIPIVKKPEPKTEVKTEAKKNNKNITNELLSQLGAPVTTGNNRGKAVGGTKTGTSNSSSLVSNYADLVIEKVRPYVDVPENIDQNATAIVKVVLLPNMTVYKVQLKQSSGNPYYDNSVQDAINKVGVFPPLQNGAKFTDFRVLYLTFKPE